MKQQVPCQVMATLLHDNLLHSALEPNSGTMTRETIVLVPGAWLAPAFYEPFLNAVSETRHHPVHCAEYPSLKPVDPTTADCKSDADAIAQTLHCLAEDEGRDILLVLYSYADGPL
ncbi:hypothetical protein BJX68DRAFT_262432 [Aspergillus pseudodeflectus]|uniref:Uncharacterized protein n=1 Tax=Aspergillus pseudodeflectus TaxID=176178 RepID=A0ABR4L336_9EURO